MYITKKNSQHSRKYGRQEQRKRDGGEQWTGKRDGRQWTDHLRQGTEDGRQGIDTWDRGQRTEIKEQRLKNGDITGDKGQRCKTVDRGPEARNRDVRGYVGSESWDRRFWMLDREGEKGTAERMTAETEEISQSAHSAPKWFSRMLCDRVTNYF